MVAHSCIRRVLVVYATHTHTHTHKLLQPGGFGVESLQDLFFYGSFC